MSALTAQTGNFFADVIHGCISREVRSMVQFAIDEVVMPNDGGPFEGEPFDPESQPFVTLLFNEIESGDWLEIWVAGPSQSGKTMATFIIPLLHDLFEKKVSPIAAVPLEEMANDKWDKDLKPVIEASINLRGDLPTSGQGAKNGKVKTEVKLNNGRSIRFMFPGGSDQNKAGFTSTNVKLTEAAGFSRGASTSKEGAPIDQIRARMESASGFNDEGEVEANSLLLAEGTVTDEMDLPLSEKPSTTDSRLACPCVACGHYVTPLRKHLKGWKKKPNVKEAARGAYWECPNCEHKIGNHDRRLMNQSMALIHKGQDAKPLTAREIKRLKSGEKIDPTGRITGDAPEVVKLFFHWTGFNNLFKKNEDYGMREWEADQLEPGTEKRELAEKRLCQFIHSAAYTPKLLKRERLSQSYVRKRRDGFGWGVLPSDTEFLSMGVDVGKWDCWWLLLAFRKNGQIHCPAYGRQPTNLLKENKEVDEHEVEAIQRCLHGIYQMALDGWIMQDTGELISPKMVVVDSNYKKGAVYQSMNGFDDKVFYPLLGKGQTNFRPSLFILPESETQYVYDISQNGHYLKYEVENNRDRFIVDSDMAKTEIQNCLRVRKGAPGAISFANQSTDDHRMISRHWCSELKDVDGKWVKTGANHLLDCGGYAWMAGSHIGYDVRNFSNAENGLSTFEKMLNAT